MKPSKPYLIGLTGGIACGKSHLSQALKAQGAVVIDADEIARSQTQTGGAALGEIRWAFGDSVFRGEELNRQALAALVFADESKREQLNQITHPLVFQEIQRQIDLNRQQTALVIDIPLLYETGYDKHCDEVWCAWAPENLQFARLLERGLSEKEARQRIQSQMSALDKAKRADRLIITSGSKEESSDAVTNIYQETIRRLARV